jgi:hypothetical protein
MNFYDMFVIDFLHEFELGVWKAVLTHIIRILHAHGEARVHMFDQRWVTFILILGSTDNS